jgi:hypothetical protein
MRREGTEIIDETIRKVARKIADEGKEVLHERPADLAKAYDVLLMLKRALQHLYVYTLNDSFCFIP